MWASWARRKVRPPKAVWQVVVFLIAMFLIGLAEESLFRGVIAQTLLEHCGASRAGIWKAVVLSGLIFGAAIPSTSWRALPWGC